MKSYPRPSWHKGSVHPYGLLSVPDVAFIESFLDMVALRFGQVSMIEIGVANGATLYGIAERCERLKVPLKWVGVDLPGYGPETLPLNCTFIPGKSEHVYVQVEGEFNLLFVDGNHDSNHVILDVLNYSQYLVPTSYLICHDSNPSEEWVGLAHPDTHQGDGPIHPDFGIGVRIGLKKLGLLDGLRKDWQFVGEQKQGTVQGCIGFQKL